jgi:hypothetical protein
VKREAREVPAGLLSQVVLDREPSVFQNSDSKTTSDITTGVDWNGYGHVPLFMEKCEMAAGLSIFFEPVGFEEANEVVRRDLGHSPHLGHRHRQFFDMNELFVLRDRLPVRQERLKMLLDGFSNVAFGVFDCLPIAIATGQGGAIGHIPVVLGFFLNHDLERIIFHEPSSLWGGVYHKPRSSPSSTQTLDSNNAVRLALGKLILPQLGHLVKELTK